MDWDGRFQPSVAAKDVMLFLCGRFGMDGGRYQAVEFGGDAIAAMPMQERMTLSNMTAEFGGQALPFLVGVAVEEMWCAANLAWSLGPLLTAGAIRAIDARHNGRARAPTSTRKP